MESIATTSKKLVPLARMRRCRGRHVRAAASRTRKKQEGKRTQIEEDERKNHQHAVSCVRGEGERRSVAAHTSTVPSLPSLLGAHAQYLTVEPPSLLPSKEYPRSVRKRRGSSESNMSIETCSLYISGSRHYAKSFDGAWGGVGQSTSHFSVTTSQQKTLQSKRNRVEPSLLLQKETPSFTGRTQAEATCLQTKKPLPQIPSSPPPYLSRTVREKTESQTDSMLTDIKEMNSHMRIVNWLWDSNNRLPLSKDPAHLPHPPSTKRPKGRGGSPSSTVSGNLVLVRQSSQNWFDAPRLPMDTRREEMSPISQNSELKSDFEDELTTLI